MKKLEQFIISIFPLLLIGHFTVEVLKKDQVYVSAGVIVAFLILLKFQDIDKVKLNLKEQTLEVDDAPDSTVK